MVRAAGSYPAGRWFESDRRYQKNALTSRPLGQAVKTSPFHGGNMGSIPVGVTKAKESLDIRGFLDKSKQIYPRRGGIAQLGERYPYKVDVTGSSPVVSTNRVTNGTYFRSKSDTFLLQKPRKRSQNSTFKKRALDKILSKIDCFFTPNHTQISIFSRSFQG